MAPGLNALRERCNFKTGSVVNQLYSRFGLQMDYLLHIQRTPVETKLNFLKKIKVPNLFVMSF